MTGGNGLSNLESQLPQVFDPCQPGSGRPGRASPSGRAGDRRRHAWSCGVLAGRAPDVPYASVPSGHPRTTTVHAHARRAVGSARPERSEGASQARGDRSAWSALGPHATGNRWSPVGTSGHCRIVGIAGHRPFTARTSDGEAALDRVRTPYPTRPWLGRPRSTTNDRGRQTLKPQHAGQRRCGRHRSSWRSASITSTTSGGPARLGRCSLQRQPRPG
jgi:hypothetical protein